MIEERLGSRCNDEPIDLRRVEKNVFERLSFLGGVKGYTRVYSIYFGVMRFYPAGFEKKNHRPPLARVMKFVTFYGAFFFTKERREEKFWIFLRER